MHHAYFHGLVSGLGIVFYQQLHDSVKGAENNKALHLYLKPHPSDCILGDATAKQETIHLLAVCHVFIQEQDCVLTVQSTCLVYVP